MGARTHGPGRGNGGGGALRRRASPVVLWHCAMQWVESTGRAPAAAPGRASPVPRRLSRGLRGRLRRGRLLFLLGRVRGRLALGRVLLPVPAVHLRHAHRLTPFGGFVGGRVAGGGSGATRVAPALRSRRTVMSLTPTCSAIARVLRPSSTPAGEARLDDRPFVEARQRDARRGGGGGPAALVVVALGDAGGLARPRAVDLVPEAHGTVMTSRAPPPPAPQLTP